MKKVTKYQIILFIPVILAALSFIVAILIDYQIIAIDYNYNAIPLIFYFANSILFLVLWNKYGEDIMYPEDRFKYTNKYTYTYKDSKELIESVSDKLSSQGYSNRGIYDITETEKLYLYSKPLTNEDVLYLWMIADLKEYRKTEENKIKKYIETYYNDYIKTNFKKKVKVEAVSLICVKNYSLKFENFVRHATNGISYLVVGLMESPKELYIAKDFELKISNKKDYEYLINKFFKVVDVIPIKKIKKHENESSYTPRSNR